MPGPRLDDVDEVQCALAVAHARWEHGDCADALRWVRRAARSAADHEHLDRALELSKAAASLARHLAARTSPATPTERMPRTPRPAPSEGRRPSSPRAPADRGWGREVPEPSASQSETRRIRRAHASGQAPASGAATLPSLYEDDDEPTAVRALRAAPPPARALPAASALTATRVAVVRQSPTARPEVLVLGPGARPPAGAACALLVACSPDDLDRLTTLLANSVVS
jgi:hypothetical protein